MTHSDDGFISRRLVLRTGCTVMMAVALVTLSGLSAAQQPPKGKPPQEALNACASLQVGDQCEMKVPHQEGLIPGQCIALPEKSQADQSDQQGSGLACLPEGGKPGETPEQ